jgi:type VI secretion system protein ImpK
LEALIMTDEFARLVIPVFQHVIQLLNRIDQGECPDLELERVKVVTLLEEAGREAKVAAQLAYDFALARHALVYWVDEVLINAPWSHALTWKTRILEWQYFRERNRAERFYEEADKAARLVSTDPIETFYLCVALGFRGKYDDDPEGFFRWAQPVFQRVEGASRQPDRFLPDEELDRKLLMPRSGPSVLLAVSLLVSLSAFVTLASFVLAVSP